MVTITLYFFGLFSPLFRTEKVFFWIDEVSLWETVSLLFENNEYYLAIIIFLFTIIFPLLKLTFIAVFIMFPVKISLDKFRKALINVSKWSMLDVFIVALLLLNLNFETRFIEMEIREGAIYFSLSIFLSMILLGLLSKDKSKSLQPATGNLTP